MTQGRWILYSVPSSKAQACEDGRYRAGVLYDQLLRYDPLEVTRLEQSPNPV